MKNLNFLMRVALLLVALLAFQTVWAYDFEQDGIYYRFDGNGVYVTSGDVKYSGEVVIPETVTHRGTVYTVSGIGIRAFENCTELTKITMGNSIEGISNWAFKNCVNLKNVNFGNSLQWIDGGAFMGCSSLTSINLPNSLKALYGIEQDGVFTGCTNLKTIHLSSSLTRIGNNAFEGCVNLKSIDLHDGITEIHNNAFKDCKSLTEVTIPASIEVLTYPFEGCTGLKIVNWNVTNGRNCRAVWPVNIEVVNFDEGVQYIPRGFLAGTSIKSVVIPDAVTEIGYDAFDDCQYLEHLTVGKSVLVSSYGGTTLCENCPNLKSLTWNVINPDPYNSPYIFTIGSKENIEQITFGDCVERIPSGIINDSKIQSVTIPASVKAIDDGAFANCSQLGTIKVDHGNYTFDSRDECNGIVETATNTLVVGCKGTIIPNTVKSIGEFAFSSCRGLTFLTIPNSVISIANYAFVNCTDLTNIVIPNSVVSIGSSEFSKPWKYGPFYGCTGLTSVTIPNSVTYVGPYAFSGCSNLSNVLLSESLKEINEGTFERCTSLNNVDFPNNLREIGKDAFSECTALKTVNLPSSLRIIDEGAFDTSGLESIEIPDSVVVNSDAFDDTQIKSVSVSSSARLMGLFIFSGTPWLENQPSQGLIYADNVVYRYNGYIPEGTVITIPEGTVGIAGNAFGYQEDEESSDFDQSHIISAEVPNSVKYIGNEAFSRCSMLKSVTTGTGLEIIGEDAFSYCSELEKVTIGRGIKSIEAYAFHECPKLVYITCLATTPPVINHKIFDYFGHEYECECFDEDTYSNAVLFVPKGSEVNYMTTDTWKKFIHIVGITVSAGASDVNGDGEVNIADINSVVNAILSGDNDMASDVNGDGEIGIADINEIVQAILGAN